MFLRVANLEICTVYYSQKLMDQLLTCHKTFFVNSDLFMATPLEITAPRLRFGLASLNNNDLIIGLWLARVKNP